ncbi:hypothetical protein GUJ93_ZPchr0014g46835 [Zizania palustris]|uniref:Uncharacterized protein n=1 Tax=Zizania palustris TaxID=103762 RepID=A0A8J5SWD6_ZIZPA|nr:hypothetical protein GUJ93_ZPchr0014g46835 [Zizania palustris]
MVCHHAGVPRAPTTLPVRCSEPDTRPSRASRPQSLAAGSRKLAEAHRLHLDACTASNPPFGPLGLKSDLIITEEYFELLSLITIASEDGVYRFCGQV